MCGTSGGVLIAGGGAPILFDASAQDFELPCLVDPRSPCVPGVTLGRTVRGELRAAHVVDEAAVSDDVMDRIPTARIDGRRCFRSFQWHSL